MKILTKFKASGVTAIAVMDWVFSVFHICSYFFRLKRFNFSSVQASAVPIYQAAWITLFTKYVLQMFLAGSLFLSIRQQVNCSNHRKYLMLTCQIWSLFSVLYILFSFTDGILLSMTSCNVIITNQTLNLEFTTITGLPSKEIIIHVSEIVFRMAGMWIVCRFILRLDNFGF